MDLWVSDRVYNFTAGTWLIDHATSAWRLFLYDGPKALLIVFGIALIGIAVSPIPGASAVTAALSAAGLPTDRFCFEGFLPAKKAARRKVLDSLATENRTMVFYESVHRIAESIDDMCSVLGAERVAFIGRELTKMHEQCVQATLGSLKDKVVDGTIVGKGEFVIAVAGAPKSDAASIDADRLLLELAEHLPAKDAAKITATISGAKRNALYARLLELKKQGR